MLFSSAVVGDNLKETKFLYDLGIYKKDIIFRKESDISTNLNNADMDFSVIDDDKHTIKYARKG